MTLVSVILPVFNAEKTIARAVKSILDQSWKDLELVVVNDGSTDGTAKVLGRFDDHRMSILQTENRGVSASANLGLQNCNGDWVARMDADDYSYPHRVEKQLNWIRRHQLDVVGCQVRIVGCDGQDAKTMQRYQDWINRETLDAESIAALRFVELPLVNPSLLARREYFEMGFADDDLPEDYDLFLRAAELGLKFGKVPEVLLDWYEMEAGLTRTNPRYSTEAFDCCRKKYLLRGPLSKINQVDLWGAGQTGKPWLKWLLANGLTVRRLIDVSPRKIGQKIHGCPVHDPNSMEQADNTPILIAVGRANARDLILPHLLERGFVPGENAWFVA